MSAERRSSSVYEIENNLFLDILDEAPLFGNKPASLIGSVFYCILLAGFAVLAVGVTWIFHPIQELDFQLLCSCNVALLVITGIFQQYLVYQVQKIRLQGYCVFSQKLKHIIRLPFATIAYGTAAMLLVMVWDPDISILSISTLLSLGDPVQGLKSNQSGYEISKGSIDPGKRIGQSYQLGPKSLGLHFPIMSQGLSVVAGNLLGDMQDKHRHKLSKLPRIIPFHKIIMLAEVVCAASFMTLYIGYVHQYNSFHSQPDVLKSLYSPLQPSSSLEGLRYQDGGRLSDQLMTLLQYQQENIHFLNEEILGLQESLSKYERSNDGSAPQVDLAHLLAARDQELRTLSAEMNQLQSELRLARSLIEEKDAEMQRIRSTNNQYVEENERLRAILGEWSSRAAKLERALELERMSNLELQKKVNSLKSRRHD